MTTTTLALSAGLALCCAAVLVLALSLSRLRSDVRRLTALVADQQQPAESAADTVGGNALVEEQVGATAVAVPVITALSDPAEQHELSGRAVAGVAFAEPLIKVLSLGYGLRRALDEERRLRYRLAIRKELRRQRRIRRHGRLRAAGQEWRQ